MNASLRIGASRARHFRLEALAAGRTRVRNHGRLATSVGGVLTGRGADIIIAE
jgi:hypothetical protein